MVQHSTELYKFLQVIGKETELKINLMSLLTVEFGIESRFPNHLSQI